MQSQNQESNNQALLAVQIQDSEIAELLDRLAATDAMFATPVSTIGDVVELTDANPSVVARILDSMRGTTELEDLQARLNTTEEKLEMVEQRLDQQEQERYAHQPNRHREANTKTSTKGIAQNSARMILLAIALFVAVIFFSTGGLSRWNKPHVELSRISGSNGTFVLYEDGSVYKLENGRETPATPAERDQVHQSHEALMSGVYRR